MTFRGRGILFASIVGDIKIENGERRDDDAAKNKNCFKRV